MHVMYVHLCVFCVYACVFVHACASMCIIMCVFSVNLVAVQTYNYLVDSLVSILTILPVLGKIAVT